MPQVDSTVGAIVATDLAVVVLAWLGIGPPLAIAVWIIAASVLLITAELVRR